MNHNPYEMPKTKNQTVDDESQKQHSSIARYDRAINTCMGVGLTGGLIVCIYQLVLTNVHADDRWTVIASAMMTGAIAATLVAAIWCVGIFLLNLIAGRK